MNTLINNQKIDGRKVPLIIKKQPGYSCGGEYAVMKTAVTGGYRLYKIVGTRWMDASLSDVPELEKYADSECNYR